MSLISLLTAAGFSKFQQIGWKSWLPFLKVFDGHTGREVLVKISYGRAAEIIAKEIQLPVERTAKIVRGYVRWEAVCRELLSDTIANKFIRSGEIEGEPYLVLEYEDARPLVEGPMADPTEGAKLIDSVALLGTRMAELCISSEQKQLAVGQYMLPNWLLTSDQRFGLPEFFGAKINDAELFALLSEDLDVQAYLEFVGDKNSEVSVEMDWKQTLESFVFMLLNPHKLKEAGTFQQLSLQLALSQHIANDAGLENPSAVEFFVSPPPKWLPFVVSAILTGTISSAMQLKDELAKHLQVASA